MNQKISDLHGARAFKEFIANTKGGSVPPFLKSVKPAAPGRRKEAAEYSRSQLNTTPLKQK